MKKGKLFYPKLLLAVIMYFPFIIILRFTLGIGPETIWNDLMKWCKK